jgi:hypothetical protein
MIIIRRIKELNLNTTLLSTNQATRETLTTLIVKFHLDIQGLSPKHKMLLTDYF